MKNAKRTFWMFLAASAASSFLHAMPTAHTVKFDMSSAYSDTQAPLLTDISQLGEIITFIDLPGEGNIKVYSDAGDEIASMPIVRGQQAQTWALKDQVGERLDDGTYVYRIQGGGKTIIGEIVIGEISH